MAVYSVTIRERNRISSLQSHGKALEKECCLPGIFCDSDWLYYWLLTYIYYTAGGNNRPGVLVRRSRVVLSDINNLHQSSRRHLSEEFPRRCWRYECGRCDHVRLRWELAARSSPTSRPASRHKHIGSQTNGATDPVSVSAFPQVVQRQ